MKDSELEIFSIEHNGMEIEQCGEVKAGFPSPAEDAPCTKLDLLKLIIRHPASTFYFRVSGVSMVDDSFDEGDIIVVDKSLDIYNNCVAVCFIDNEFTLKRVVFEKDYALLMPANKRYKPIKVTSDNNFMVWGIVTYVIKKV